jgi:hypothetical protein
MWMGSAELHSHPLFPFCADGNTEEWTAPVWSGRSFNPSSGRSLIVQGKRVTSVKTTGPINVDEPDNMFFVLNDIPPIYSYFKSVPTAFEEAELNRKNIQKEVCASELEFQKLVRLAQPYENPALPFAALRHLFGLSSHSLIQLWHSLAPFLDIFFRYSPICKYKAC